MHACAGENLWASSGKGRVVPWLSGFCNDSGKDFLKAPKDWTREYIPETGRSYQKVRKTQIKPRKSRSEKNQLEWKSPCFILSGRSAAW